ncbi:MAG: hypothetical protein QNJ29_12815, partial [Rhizobiaceae bacterium]|nr:hypothetical protein [Rhizobiaceae bacterium]
MSSGHSPTSSSSRAPNNQSGGASSSTAQTGAAAAPTNPPQNPNAVAGAPAHQPNQHYQPAPAQAAGGGQQAAAGGGQQAAPPPAANAGGMVGQAQPVQNVGVYGPAPAGVNAMGVAGGPANRNWLGRMRHRIYKNPRKTAGYSTLALLLGAGVGTTAAYFAGAFDSNSPNHPKAENHSVKGVRKRNTKSKTGIKNDPVRSHDLTKHVSPANESSDAKIDNKTFQLYASTDIEEEGATEVTSNGTWKVTQTGKLTFTPGDTFIAGVAIIFYTVKDKRGIDSNRASVTIQYGPEASNGTLDNQPIDKKSAVFDIAKNVKPIDSSEEFAIDLSTAELVFRDRSGNEVVNSNSLAASGGTWSLADGKISFTPGPGFVSQMAIIGYQVKDKMGT